MKNKEDVFLAEFTAALEGKITDIVVRRARRVYAKANADILDITSALKDKLGINYLGTITGLDNGTSFEVLYHFMDEKSGVMFTINVALSYQNAVINSITQIIPGALWYEKELEDILGIEVSGLPKGNRYPLQDDFPVGQYPLRKTWSATEYIEKAEKDLCQK